MKPFFIVSCLVLSFLSQIFAQEKTVAIARTKDKNISQYEESINGLKKYLLSKYKTVVFKEYDLNELNVYEKIVEDKPDVIFTLGTVDTKKVSRNIENIPIVFSLIFTHNEDKSNLFNKNVTGVSLDIPPEFILEKIKVLLPKEKNKIVAIYNREEHKKCIKELEKETQKLGFKLEKFPINTPKDFPQICQINFDVLLIIPDTIVCQPEIVKNLIFFGITNKKVVIGISQNHVKSGALFAVVCDYEDIGYQAGEIIEKIFNGTSVGTIPIYEPRKTKLYINKTVADRIGIKIPDNIIKEAEEVYGK
ncbi:MAG: ABC transporter substrate-binding protein [Endomicrobiia bacterium]